VRLVNQDEIAERLEAYAERIRPFGFSGAFLVGRGAHIVYERGVGYADRRTESPITPETIFDTGSITKQFTAATILALQEAGRLRVTDTLATFFPEVPADKRAITVHQLLSHSAGLHFTFGHDYDPLTRDGLIAAIMASKLGSVPGTAFNYSNVGYTLLAAIIELVEACSYEQVLRERILRPVGLTETGYVLPDWDRTRIAHGYDGSADWGTSLDHLWASDGPYWNLRGSGGLLSSLRDLHRWHRALRDGSVLSEESRVALFRPNIPMTKGVSYAYGWSISKTPRDTTVASHHGTNGVFLADFRRYLDEDVVVLMFTNQATPGSAIVHPLQQFVFGPVPELPPPVDDHSNHLERFAGDYGSSIIVRVAADRTGLLVQPRDQPAFSVISAIPPKYAATAAQRNAKQHQALADAVAGDYRRWIALQLEDTPDVRARQHVFWDGVRDTVGTITAVNALGEVASGNGVDSYACIIGSEGALLVRIAWSHDECIQDVDAAPQLPEFRFARALDGTFINYDLRNQTVVRLRFGSDLTIEGPAGTFRVVRAMQRRPM
jgi:CubicO group peptidase (beta-lactamase class C family)